MGRTQDKGYTEIKAPKYPLCVFSWRVANIDTLLIHYWYIIDTILIYWYIIRIQVALPMAGAYLTHYWHNASRNCLITCRSTASTYIYATPTNCSMISKHQIQHSYTLSFTTCGPVADSVAWWVGITPSLFGCLNINFPLYCILCPAFHLQLLLPYSKKWWLKWCQGKVRICES